MEVQTEPRVRPGREGQADPNAAFRSPRQELIQARPSRVEWIGQGLSSPWSLGYAGDCDSGTVI